MIQTNKWNLIIKFEWNIRDLICITKKILTLQSNQKSFKSIHNKFPFFNFLQITIHLYLTLYYQTTSILKQFLKQYRSLYKLILHSLRNLYNLSKKRKRKKKPNVHSEIPILALKKTWNALIFPSLSIAGNHRPTKNSHVPGIRIPQDQEDGMETGPGSAFRFGPGGGYFATK